MDIGLIATQVVAFLFALSFHEAAHAWTADRFGDPTARMLGRVTMNPLSHIDPFMTVLFPALMIMAGLPPFGAAKPVPVNTRNLANPRRDHAWIAAAGPISNILLAIPCILLLRLALAGGLPFSVLPTSIADPLASLLLWSLQVNLLLAAFNMLPVPPLDGSWILSSFLRGSAEQMYRSLQPYGFLILMALIWSGVLNHFLVPVLRFGQMLVLL